MIWEHNKLSHDSFFILVGSMYFTKLDLKAGSWQVELKEEDNAKTAFQVL